MDQTRNAFAALVAPGEGRLVGELDRGAFLIAAAVDRTVDVSAQCERLDELASRSTARSAADLAIELFGGAAHDPSVHFAGNHVDYYDAENSMLNRVLDCRVGIPITLSVLLIEIGRRRGISMHGVGMPGHFLTGSADGYIDAYHGGIALDEPGCHRLFERLAGSGASLPPGALQPTPPAMILKRMLFNLSAIGASQRQRGILRAARSLLSAFPDATHRDHVQHAYAAADLSQYHEAVQAAERALPTIPESVRDKLRFQIGRWQAQLN